MADIPLPGGAPGQIPAAPLSSVPGPKALLSAQDLGALFAPGAVVSGRVVQALGPEQYLLAMRGANVVVMSQASLRPDSVVRFQVVATGEQVQLRMLDGSAGDQAQTSTTAGRLQALGLPPGTASTLALGAFEDAGAPLSRAPLLAAAAALEGQAQGAPATAQASPAALAAALAALAREALPATPATIGLALRALSAALPAAGATLPAVQQAAGALLDLLAAPAGGAGSAPAAAAGAPAPGQQGPQPGSASSPTAGGAPAPGTPPGSGPVANATAPAPLLAGAPGAATAPAPGPAAPALPAAGPTPATTAAPAAAPVAAGADAAAGTAPLSARPGGGSAPDGGVRMPAAGQASAPGAPAGSTGPAGSTPATAMANRADGVAAAAAAGGQGAGAGAAGATPGAATAAANADPGLGDAQQPTLGALRTLMTLSVPDATVDGAPAVMQALALSGVRSSAAAGPTVSLIRHLAAALPPAPPPGATAAAGSTAAGQSALTEALVHAVREGAAATLVKPAALADYDLVLGVPLQDQGAAVPTRLAVATRPTAGGTATYLRVDTELSHLGAVSVRLSGIAGGPVVITLLADGGGARALAAALPALAQGLHELGISAGLRVASLAGEDGHG